MKIFNFIYNHFTPYGVLQNGIPYERLHTIMKNSLIKYEEYYYNLPLIKYLQNHSSLTYSVNVVSAVYFRSDKYAKGTYNFFVLDDFNNQELDISDHTLYTMQQWDDYYIVLMNYDNDVDKTKVDALKKFKSKHLVNKNRILYVSNIKPKSNIQWKYIQSNKTDLAKDILLKKLDKKIIEIKENKFL